MLHALIRAAAAAALAVALPAMAHIQVFTAELTGAAEVPPVDSTGHGTVLVTLDDHDFTMRVEVSFADLVGTVTASHIHCCTAAPFGGSAGVATPVPTFPGFPSGVTSGSYDQTFDLTAASSWNPSFLTAQGGDTATAFAVLATAMGEGRTYLNIHTTFVGSGEIRGFLAPVPEPGTTALSLAGLALLGLRLRRTPAA